MRFSVDSRGHRFQITLDVFLQIHLADGIDAVLLIIGKPRQPFGSGKQRFRKAVDDHCSLGIDSIRLIPLDGGFVDADPFSQLRHGQLEFCPALFDPFSDLFRAEHFFCLQGVHLLTNASIAYSNLICSPILRIFSKIILIRLQNELTSRGEISIMAEQRLQNRYI